MDRLHHAAVGRAVGGDGVGGYEAKFLLVRTLLGAAEAGFFPGMIYPHFTVVSPAKPRQHYGAFYMGAPLALTLGSPLSARCWRCMGLWAIPAGSGCL